MTAHPEPTPLQPLGRCRPGMPPAAAHAARPHAVYKAELRAWLHAARPQSVLDVGCGEGGLLNELREGGCPRCVGLEVEEVALPNLGHRGIEVVPGRAEAMPFPDRSFDVVVLEYTAHHLADLAAGLREAARVARRGVAVLDPWYDSSLPSQVVARRYDEWCKQIDRRLGLIHDPCPTVAQLAAPFQAMGGFDIDARQRLVLRPLALDDIREDGERHLDRLSGDRTSEAAALGSILRSAEVDGVTDDGAVLFLATAP